MIKYLVLVCFVIVPIFEVTLGQIDCSNRPNGVHGYGCRSYTVCKNGKGKVVDCKKTEAFNYETKQCESIDQVPPPCGNIDHKCDVLKEGRHAIKPDCLWFYTCLAGQYLGASPCNANPHNGPLVFDEQEQLCNWKQDVLKPCGLKTPEPTPVEPPLPDVPAPVEQPLPDVPTPVEQPLPDVPAPVEQPHPDVPTPVEQPQPDVPAPVEQPLPHVPTPVEQPHPDVPTPVEQPLPDVPTPVEQPQPDVPAPVEQPHPDVLTPVEEPQPDVPAPVEQPHPDVPTPVEHPQPDVDAPTPVEQPLPDVPTPVVQPLPDVPTQVEQGNKVEPFQYFTFRMN